MKQHESREKVILKNCLYFLTHCWRGWTLQNKKIMFRLDGSTIFTKSRFLLSTPKYNLESRQLIQIATQNHPLTPQMWPPDPPKSLEMHPKTSPGAPRTSFGKHWRYKDHKKMPKGAPETPGAVGWGAWGTPSKMMPPPKGARAPSSGIVEWIEADANLKVKLTWA